MKKIFSMLLVLVITLGMSLPVLANENSAHGIRSLETQIELVEYAQNIFPKHLHALVDIGDLNGSVQDYILGEPFTVFNVKENTNSSCFPVLQNREIVAILEISEKHGEYNSILSTSFSKELNNLLEQRQLNDFVLLTDGVNLQAFNGERSINLFKLYDDGDEVGELYNDFRIPISSLSKVSSASDMGTELLANDYRYRSIRPTAVDGPTSYRTVNVNGVSQSGNTCWAAVCATMINFYRGESLSDVTVARYVFGDNWNQGAVWNDMRSAYNHWGLYPSQTGVISFSDVKSEINASRPMHLGLDGHSVGLIGYEDWVGSHGGSNDRILILMEPNGAVHASVRLNSSGNFTYRLGGGENAWICTRRF